MNTNKWSKPKRREIKRDGRGQKPSRLQSERDKRAALRAAAGIAVVKNPGNKDRDTSEHMASGSESDTAEALGETLLG